MKSLCVASLVVLALVGSWHPAEARTKDPSKFTVTMSGHPHEQSGAATDNIMVFSQPVEIPHAILPAGTYRFQFLTPTLVRVTSMDYKTTYATFSAISAVRTVPPNKGQVRFQDFGGSQPLRLIAWYLTSDSTGSAPLYPKAQRHAPLVAINTASN